MIVKKPAIMIEKISGHTSPLKFSSRPIRQTLIREDIVTLTEDFRSAVVLCQFIYWTQLRCEFQQMFNKEYWDDLKDHTICDQGWIITSAQELCEETMLGLSRQTMRDILKNLIEAGWLQESMLEKRTDHKIAKYRLDLLKLHNDLQALGYCLMSYAFPLTLPDNNFSKTQRLNFKKLASREENHALKEPSTQLAKPYSLSSSDQKSELDQCTSKEMDINTQEMLQIFSEIVLNGQELKIFPARAKKLKRVFKEQLGENLENWRTVCQNVTRSKFLMGESKGSDFKVTIDWLLEGHTAIKIFEGSYGVGDREAICKNSTVNVKTPVNSKTAVQGIEALDEAQSMKELRLWFLERFGVFDYDSWFKDTIFEGFDNQSFKIMANSSFISEQISCRFGHQIRDFLQEKYNRQLIFNVRLKPNESLPSQTSTN